MKRHFLTSLSQNMTLIRALMSKLLFGVRDSDRKATLSCRLRAASQLRDESLAPIWLEFPLLRAHTKNFLAGLARKMTLSALSEGAGDKVLLLQIYELDDKVRCHLLDCQISFRRRRRRRATVFLSARRIIWEWVSEMLYRGVLRSSLSGVSCGTETALVRRPTTPPPHVHCAPRGSGCAAPWRHRNPLSSLCNWCEPRRETAGIT